MFFSFLHWKSRAKQPVLASFSQAENNPYSILEYEGKKEKKTEHFGCQTAHGKLCTPGHLGTSVTGCLLTAAGAPLMRRLYGKK